MADIIIRGMEMPKEKSICVEIFADGGVHEFASPFLLGLASELPEHGRLIDADELLKDHGLGTDCSECKRDKRSCQFEMIHTTMDFCGWIEDAPTTIHASGGDEV